MLCAVCYRFLCCAIYRFICFTIFYEKFSQQKPREKKLLYTGDIMMLKWFISTFNVCEVCGTQQVNCSRVKT